MSNFSLYWKMSNWSSWAISPCIASISSQSAADASKDYSIWKRAIHLIISFLTWRHFLTIYSRWLSKNIVTKGKIAQCLQLYSMIILSFFREFSYIFLDMFSKSSAADLLYVGKVYVSVPCCLSVLTHLS